MTQSTETARVPEEMTGRQRRTPVGKISSRQTFRALRHRNYRLFFYGQLVSLIGTWMQQTAMSWLVYQITGSKLLLGVVAAVGSAPMMLFSLWGGAIADRYPKRRIIIWTQVCADAAAFFLAGLAWFGPRDHLAHRPHRRGYRHRDGFRYAGAAGIHGRNDEPRRSAQRHFAQQLDLQRRARRSGPSLAGLVIGTLGTPICFLLNGLSFIAVIIGLLHDAAAAICATGDKDAPCASALSGLAYVLQTSPCPHDPRAARRLWAFSAGPTPCSCRPLRAMSSAWGADGYGVAHVSERNRRAGRRPRRRNLRSFVPSTRDGARRRLDFLCCAPRPFP